ncbi:related to mitochondrial 60s ribosomal protein [Rhynchosporium agropyri]|uniref:Large ribosomal subunit protein mL49 n=1 Tax=Rhynchosporium agropyri TaxID=914238 RepID=A0A1E1KJ11_9HELO|nr:related to mitochondrial 60s ribosomal protein [Rhynchosporium agropyri]
MVSSLPLTFLRPMALPRVATIHKYLGFSQSTLRKASTSKTTTTASTSSPSLTATPSSSASPEPSSIISAAKTAPSAPLKPYFVLRTPSNQLPVYQLAKRGGNMKLTRVRKIEGDVNALRNDLQKELGMSDKEVVVNQLTRQVMVKGHMKSQIEKFFLSLQQ